ncbi:MAG TPA: dihydroorotate dehydrogenase electron transfer subunit [Pseudolabrys sp.]|nr:dihydroorotate dehydrogenase electron transfer subunit [Pseudolabrys sp.]
MSVPPCVLEAEKQGFAIGSEATCPSPLAIADTQAFVVSNKAVNERYCHLILEAGDLAASAKAGQFFNIACPATTRDLPYLRRPMSVYRTHRAQGQVEFLYKVTGAGTRGLASACPGESIRILGPLGNGFELDPRLRNVVVLGRGVGLATLAPLAEMAAENGVGVTAMLSAESRSLVMSVDRFEKCGAYVKILTDEEGTSDPDNVERLLLGLIESGKAGAFYTCGSNRLMLLMKRLASVFRIRGQVALEQQMACGLGMCFCCVRNFESPQGQVQRRVCIEGPVFELSEALPW